MQCHSTKSKPQTSKSIVIGNQNRQQLTRQHQYFTIKIKLIYEKSRNSVNFYAQVNHDATSGPRHGFANEYANCY